MPQTPAQAAANERRRAFALSQKRGGRGRFLVGTGHLPPKEEKPAPVAVEDIPNILKKKPPVPVSPAQLAPIATQPPVHQEKSEPLVDSAPVPHVSHEKSHASVEPQSTPPVHDTQDNRQLATGDRKPEDHVIIPHPEAGKKEGILDKLKALFG